MLELWSKVKGSRTFWGVLLWIGANLVAVRSDVLTKDAATANITTAVTLLLGTFGLAHVARVFGPILGAAKRDEP